MKFIYIFSLAGILSSQIYAQNDKDFINESWYNSAEMKSTADLVKIYDQNCVTQENEACSQLGASILEKFKNEPYRVCRRPTFLRECPDDKTKIYP
ncbi:hypothetical protein [Acinetobacter indicus]|uniref:hypothetical protein n=1 Tax=Acinetobacter indicus TaxID=756892 RepID=UPI00148F5661|nr:hypothetical protein [Acinetobacter indicus]